MKNNNNLLDVFLKCARWLITPPPSRAQLEKERQARLTPFGAQLERMRRVKDSFSPQEKWTLDFYIAARQDRIKNYVDYVFALEDFSNACRTEKCPRLAVRFEPARLREFCMAVDGLVNATRTASAPYLDRVRREMRNDFFNDLAIQAVHNAEKAALVAEIEELRSRGYANHGNRKEDGARNHTPEP